MESIPDLDERPDGSIPRWIWTEAERPAPRNRYTWFRRLVDPLTQPDANLTIAANSTAAVWVNGHRVFTKVARFAESDIRSQVVNVARYLRPGPNVFVALHHSWGNVITFQRTGLTQAGLWISGGPVVTDQNWRWRYADEFEAAVDQIPGLLGPEHTRIRFPVHWDTRVNDLAWQVHSPDFDDSAWLNAITVAPPAGNPERPLPAETPPQRAAFRPPATVLAAGAAHYAAGVDPAAAEFTLALQQPDPCLREAAAAALIDASGVWSVSAKAGQHRYLTVDFSRPVHGYPVLTAAATGKVRIRLGYTELAHSHHDGSPHVDSTGWLRSDGIVGPGYLDSILLADGPRELLLPEERTCRWLRLEIQFLDDATVDLSGLGIEQSQYPILTQGSLDTGDDRIQQIVSLGLIHAEVTMTDAYVDTPGREDGQWIEDARPRALLAARWFGDTALRRLLIRTIAAGQAGDGNLRPFYPSNFTIVAPIWDWSLQWVGMLHDEYFWSAEADFVVEHYRTLQRFWEGLLADVGPDGLWRANEVLGDLRTAEVPGPGETSVLLTPWVIQRLEESAALATVAADTGTAAEWAKCAATMRAGYRRHLLRTLPEMGILYAPDVVDPATAEARGLSQASQLTAVAAGLLSPKEAVRLIDWAFPGPEGTPPAGMARWNNPTWSGRALMVLSHLGFEERAVRHLIERYAPYLPGHPRNPTPLRFQGPYGGPLPEYWISADDLGLSIGGHNHHINVDPTGSHGWGAVPLLWMHDALLGVRVASPGGGELAIHPRPGGLPRISGTTVTPRGQVFVSFDSQTLELRVVIPAGVRALVAFPTVCAEVTMESAGREIVQTEVTVGPGDHCFRPCRAR